LALHESRRARSITRSVRGLIIISHVRFATHGGRSVVNTHPRLYRGFVFAHNGYLDRERLLRLVKQEYRELESETDSEVLFLFIVQEALDIGDFVRGIKKAVDKIKGGDIDFSSLNFIASDGIKLYALRYARHSLDYYTLYYLERPREALHLDKLSSKTAELIRMKLARGEKAILVASEPLTEEELLEIPNKRMLVIDRSLRTEVIDLS